MAMDYFKFFVLTILFCVIKINTCLAHSADSCASKRNCGECIRDSTCSWHIKTEDNKDHCRPAKKSNKDYDNIVNPDTSGHITDHLGPGHLTPESYKVKIRPGKPHKLPFQYTHKVNHPVDIYFLMDMSKSMQYYRDKISTLASNLVEKMKEMTADVHIGFGSFVDKTLLPYVNAFPNKIERPCTNCEIPYSFKNHLKLTKKVEEFSYKVNSTPISANIDGPEGSLEALLQVIVCTEEIGWRQDTRHLIIVSTDDTFHIAGDGKLAGIVEPNDGECHLKNDEYTHGHLHDYPSIGQLKQKAADKSMHILFIVTPAQEKLYNKLRTSLLNTFLGILRTNSENIINLVTEFYKNITSSIWIEHNFENNFDIKFSSSNCSKSHNNTDNKFDVLNNETCEFTANIHLKSCPNDEKEKYIRNYYIKLNSLAEKISIQVEMLCDCPCEHIGNKDFEQTSNKCSKNGDLQCGICKCNSGKIGDQCQCDINEDIKNFNDTSKCRNVNSTEDCSGAGECKCGQCDCTSPYYGTHCQCNDETCFTNKNNEKCSNHGNCNCGKCVCNEDWGGNKCDCSKLTDNCILPGSNETCSGNGECKCGKCVCSIKEQYGGTYCDICRTCPKKCSDFESCVQYHYNSELNNDLKCENFTINETEILNGAEKTCNYQDEKNCLIMFSLNYTIDDGVAEIYTQKVCPPTQAGFYSLYTIASILLIGIIAMLIWKAFAIMADRREYEKFENETKNPNWNKQENPLFKKATSEFQNPLFKKSN